MIRAAIFDVDGTLVDSVDHHADAWRQTFQHFGYDFPRADIRSQIGKGGDQLVPVFLPDADEARIEEIDKYRGELYRSRFLRRVQGFPKVPELFDRIRNNKQKVFLASSGKADEIKVYKTMLGIEDLVDGETTSDDADRSKPHPDIFEAALAKLEMKPGEAIVIGDTPYDAIAARRAGIDCIGLRCGQFPEEELRRAGCVVLYDHPADLLDRYASSPLAETFPASRMYSRL